MGYAIYHTSKGKGSGGGLSNHIDRTEGKEHTYKNADPNRKEYNHDLTQPDFKGLSISEAVKKRISEGYKSPRKIRADSVKYLTHVLTGTHEDMVKIWNSKGDAHNDWIRANAEFMKQEFGKENIVKAVLHMDEKTPHLHIVTVPLTKDGRLSAKEIMGGSKEMKLRQDRYAEKMKVFGLERGIKGSKRKHQTAKEYDREVKLAEIRALKRDIKPVLGTFGVKKDETIDKYKKELKSSYLALERKNLELKKYKDVAKTFDAIKNRNFDLKSENIDLKIKEKNSEKAELKRVKQIVLNPKVLKKFQEEFKKEGRDQGRSI